MGIISCNDRLRAEVFCYRRKTGLEREHMAKHRLGNRLADEWRGSSDSTIKANTLYGISTGVVNYVMCVGVNVGVDN